MRFSGGWLLLFLLCLRQPLTKPLLDPALQSLINTKAVSDCEVLVQFRGPLTKSLWNKKFIKQPAQALLMLKEKFSDDVMLSKLDIRKIYWLNQSLLINLSINQLQKLQSRTDVNYISLNREFISPNSKTHKGSFNDLMKDSEVVSHALKTLQIPQVWNQLKLKGKNVRIGFLGRGFSSHPDLNEASILYRNFNSSNTDDTVEDNDTHLLGLIGASSLSGRPLGVAPEAEFIVAGVFDRQNKTKLSTILEALQWLSDPDLNPVTKDGAEIIANSWGYKQAAISAEKPLWDATIALNKIGILSVFPAGDKGPKPGSILSPGAYPHAIAVGAAGRQFEELRYSSKGPSRWENVNYDKPDFLAPGSHVESLLPGPTYGRVSGTRVSTALLTGSLALIKQSNPNLSWLEILNISKQASFVNESQHRILQVHDAAVLAQQGAKISVHIEGPPSGISKVILLDHDKSFTTSSMGYKEFYLEKGSYRVAFTAQGFAPKIDIIKVIPRQNQKLRIKLEKSEISNLNLSSHDAKNRGLSAKVEFLSGLGQKFIGITQSLKEALPEGIYPVTIKSRAYKSITTSIIHTKSITQHRFQLDLMPVIALVNQRNKHNLESYTARSLKQIGIKYDLIDNPQSFEEIEAYQILIWESGDTLNEQLSRTDKLLLAQYLRQGGSVLITGQDLAYWLQETQFLSKILGTKFEQDHSSSRDLLHKELQLQLYSENKSQSQLFMDTVKPRQSDSKCYINYGNGLCAGVLRYHPKGKSIMLGFSLAGLPDAQRKLLINSILKDLKPAVEHLLDKIENAYLSNRASYFQMMKSLEIYQPSFAQKASRHIELRRRKSAWRPLLHDILHDRRRHIFDQLYDMD